MTLKIDLHVHTIASKHAFNTVYELVQEAKKKKMTVIGISDHGPSIPDSMTDNSYFGVLAKRIPEKIEGIRVLKSAELNPVVKKQDIDINPEILEKLDYALLFYHPNPDNDTTDKHKNTELLIKLIKKYPKIKILSHPYLIKGGADLDLEKLFTFACKNNILLELNLSTLEKNFYPNTDFTKIKEMISIVKKYNKKVIVNSDAHFMTQLGDDSVLTPALMKELGLTKEMIINNYPEELEKILGVRF